MTSIAVSPLKDTPGFPSKLHKAPSGKKRQSIAVSQPVDSLSDRELLQQLVGRSQACPRSELAMQLLCKAGGLGGLRRLIDGLLSDKHQHRSPAVSTGQLRQLAAMLELGRRAARVPLLGMRLTSHVDVQEWAAGRIADLDYEEVWVLALDGANRVRAECCAGRGGLHGCGLLPSDLLRPVVRSAASAMVLVHNHPSGDPTPSRDDVVMTQAVARGCSAIGITLLDHVIVSRSDSRSMAELGLFDQA